MSLALQCLTDHGLYESQAEALLREEVLGQLHSLMLTWIGRVAEIRGECELFFDPSAVGADMQANRVCSSCSSVLKLARPAWTSTDSSLWRFCAQNECAHVG